MGGWVAFARACLSRVVLWFKSIARSPLLALVSPCGCVGRRVWGWGERMWVFSRAHGLPVPRVWMCWVGAAGEWVGRRRDCGWVVFPSTMADERDHNRPSDDPLVTELNRAAHLRAQSRRHEHNAADFMGKLI